MFILFSVSNVIRFASLSTALRSLSPLHTHFCSFSVLCERKCCLCHGCCIAVTFRFATNNLQQFLVVLIVNWIKMSRTDYARLMALCKRLYRLFLLHGNTKWMGMSSPYFQAINSVLFSILFRCRNGYENIKFGLVVIFFPTRRTCFIFFTFE